MKTQTTISQEKLDKALNFEDYYAKVTQMATEGRTSGNLQTEKLINFTGLNLQRMKRLLKTIAILPETIASLGRISAPQYWIVLAEAWCGDVAQNLPIISAMAHTTPNVELLILWRDENPDVMDAYLTNGGRSIPKLIIIGKESLEELGVWGPRPQQAQQMVKAYKADPQEPYEDFVKKLQLWYMQDKGISLQKELVALATR